jgi:argininosuccinate synthase
MKDNKRCVLAFSGGLDTTTIVTWLKQRGYEIHAVLVDVGLQEDLTGHVEKALRLGAKSAVICDAQPAMLDTVIPKAIGLAATYEGNYRLGTALARPFIAAEQVRLAKKLGGATLVHGATGKGNDQIRFEFAYRSLAPECPVLAPWKNWELRGRRDMIEFLQKAGVYDDFAVTKDYSMDENLWHLSVEGSDLEDPMAMLDIDEVLAAVADRFAGGVTQPSGPSSVRVRFENGIPVALAGREMPLSHLIATLNSLYRAAPWAWDLVIENRFTGIKSRGVYINPAAKLLHLAVDGLARCSMNKPVYEQYCELGRQYGTMIYRGEYFSDQRVLLDAAAAAAMAHLNGEVTVQLSPTPYVAQVRASESIFRKDLSTFEKSDFSHQDAAGFIRLSWLGNVGRSFSENQNGDAVEAGEEAASDVRSDQSVSGRRLVPVSV